MRLPRKVYVCYDQRLKRLPVWLMYFEKTNWVVNTTEAPFGVWRKRYSKGRVRGFVAFVEQSRTSSGDTNASGT